MTQNLASEPFEPDCLSSEGCKRNRKINDYRIVANASSSCFEAHVGLLRLLMKGIFDPYVL